MPLSKLVFKPGVNRDQTDYASEGGSQTAKNWNAMVRPVVAFIFVGELVLINFLSLAWAMWSGVDFVVASQEVFSTDEMAIVASIIGFYFGSRTWEKK